MPLISLPVLALCAAALLWASSFVALKIAFNFYDPMFVIFGRMLVATLCFACFWKHLRPRRYQAGDWKPLLFMAFCEPCVYFIFEALAVKNTQAAQAGMIVAMLPLMMAVASHFILKETIHKQTLFGFGLAVSGAVLLSAGAIETAGAPNPVLGNIMELLAMACATGYMITLKKLCSRYSPWFLTALQALLGSIFFFALLFLPGTNLPDGLYIEGLGAILYLGIGATILAYGLYNYGTSQIPAHQASAFVNLIPVLTLFLSLCILGERLTLVQYIASGLVLLGVFLSQKRHKNTTKIT